MNKYFIILTMLCVTSVLNAQSLEDLESLYGQGKFNEVIDNSANMLANEPDDPIINMLVGRSYADKMNFEEAIPYLRKAIESDRTNSWPKAWSLVYLGSCYFAIGNREESIKYIKECISMNATKNVTNSALIKNVLFGFDQSYNNWEARETEHFVFHFQPLSLKDINDIDKYIKIREMAFMHISEFFVSNLPKKIDFFIWHSREDIKAVLKSNGGFAKPEYCIIHACFDQTPGHEITHVVSNYTATVINKTVLINEGTAVYFDQTSRDQLALARKAIKEKGYSSISLKEIWNNRVMPEAVMYPIGGAFVKYLIDTEGKDKYLELFKDQTYQNGHKIYGDKFEKIVSEFENSLFQ